MFIPTHRGHNTEKLKTPDLIQVTGARIRTQNAFFPAAYRKIQGTRLVRDRVLDTQKSRLDSPAPSSTTECAAQRSPRPQHRHNHQRCQIHSTTESFMSRCRCTYTEREANAATLADLQVFQCTECLHRFTGGPASTRLSLKIIRDSISMFNLGHRSRRRKHSCASASIATFPTHH